MQNKPLVVLITVALLSLIGAARAEISIDELVEQAQILEGPVAVRDLPRWQPAKKILIRDLGIDREVLSAVLGDVEFALVRSATEGAQHAKDADAIIGFCNDEIINAAKRLVWVQIYWAGAESCLSQQRIGNGDVVLTNMQKMSSPVIAEHAIAMMMALARHLPQFVHAMDAATWDDSSAALDGMTPIAGKKLLVVGLGGIGTEVARLGAALGMQVSGTRNSSRSGPDYIDYVGLSHELLTLAAEADVVVNALPLTADTEGLLDAEFFAAVKPGAIFVNVGRGQTVVTDELIKALQSGRVSAAGLDVTEPEPLPADSPLWKRDDVIITPHVAGTGGERERHRILLLENLRRYVAGEPLLNIVDPDKGY